MKIQVIFKRSYPIHTMLCPRPTTDSPELRLMPDSVELTLRPATDTDSPELRLRPATDTDSPERKN